MKVTDIAVLLITAADKDGNQYILDQILYPTTESLKDMDCAKLIENFRKEGSDEGQRAD